MNSATTILSAFTLGGATASVPVKDRTFTLQIAPQGSAKTDLGVRSVRIRISFYPGPLEAGGTLFAMPLITANVDTLATSITSLRVTDKRGLVPLLVQDKALAGGTDADDDGTRREWIVKRRTEGAVTATYSIPATNARPPRGPAPPISLMADDGAFSGAGSMFLLHPTGERRYRLSIKWILSALPRDAIGVSSLGVGSSVSKNLLSGSELETVFFLAGKLGRVDDVKSATGFFAAWQGKPPFEPRPLLNWTKTLYSRYLTFFRPPESNNYGVFLRYNPINAGGGVAMYGSFVATFGSGAGANEEKLRFTLAHEMFHTFQPKISRPGGLETAWFSEGSANLYQSRLPLRYGMVGSKAFLEDLNYYASRYYTNAMADQPNSEIAKRFWSDTRIRTLPYDRGMFYLATVDAAVRRRSGGRRSLDNILIELLAAERSGHETRLADWEGALLRDLGSGAVTEFQAFLAGRVPVPPSDAFGPCFRRSTAKLRRYELGFDSAVLAEPRRIVRGLLSGSAAAMAGLRNGDEIVLPVPQDAIQGNQTEMLKLRIRRGKREFGLSYLPRGTTVDAYQWERVPTVAEAQCPF
ncbi:peptidase M61 [Sphingomonas sp. CFBP 13720]|nr:peptidase M61 [Sphingomonas sp. CFBP 13720]